jgi:dolichol kinase
MFVPGMLYEPAFLQLAFSVALAAFIYLEYLRFFAVWPYGKNIHMFLTEFIDSRDLGPVILSHVYLLLGCAESVWLEG